MEPLVTCIIPVFNRENFISDTIQSVIDQSYKNWELIVIDDRSKDKSFQRAFEQSQKDPRIHVVTNTNKQGPGGARNKGIEIAKGEIIAFLDSDDFWLPNHLQNGVEALVKFPSIDWYFCDFERFSNNEIITNSYFNDITPKFNSLVMVKVADHLFTLEDHNLFEACVDGFLPAYIQASLIRTRFFKNVMFNEDLFGVEDACLLMEYIIHNGKFIFSIIKGLRYVIHEANLSNSNNRTNNPQKNLERFIEGEKMNDFFLAYKYCSKNHLKILKRKRAELFSWGFCYNAFLPMRKYSSLVKYHIKTILLFPWKHVYWKMFINSMIKIVLNFIGISKTNRTTKIEQ